MGIVYGLRFGLFTEVVQDGVHGVFVAEEGDLGAFSVEELEGLFAEIRDAVALGLFHGGVLQDLGGLADPVHAEGGQLVVLVGPAHHVIAVSVPGESIGAEDVGLPAVFQPLAFGGVIAEVAEGYFPFLIDGPVYYVDVFVNALVFWLDAVRNGDIAVQLCRPLNVGEGGDFSCQGLALGGGDELGGGNGVRQQLQLRRRKGPAGHIIAVLPGVDGPHVVARRHQGLHVPLYGDAIGVQAPALLQNPNGAGGGDGVLLVAFVLQQLQHP